MNLNETIKKNNHLTNQNQSERKKFVLNLISSHNLYTLRSKIIRLIVQTDTLVYTHYTLEIGEKWIRLVPFVGYAGISKGWRGRIRERSRNK